MSNISEKKKLPTLYAKTQWKDASKYKPIPYDLLMLETEDGKVCPGWWTGTSWDGRRLNLEKKVVAFKNIYNTAGPK